jgi:teichuronic acid exporter
MAKVISIRKELIASTKWNIVGSISGNLTMVIGMIITARFVSPEEFGLVAIAGACTTFFVILSQFGFAQAIVGLSEADKELIDTLFTVSIALAIFFYLALALLTPLMTAFYKQPTLGSVLLISGTGIFLSMPVAIPVAILQRKLDYRSQAIVRISMAIVALIGIVIAAYFKLGIWILVLPTLLGQFISGIIAFWLSEYRPTFALNRDKLKKSLNFSLSALISNFCNFICKNVVVFAGGKVWSPTVLGYYSFANSKSTRLFDLIAGQIAPAIFPVLRRFSNDIPRVRNAALKMTRFGSFVFIPSYILLILSAPLLFPILFGNRWDFAILPFQILCSVQIARSVTFISNPILYALGLPHVSAKIVVIRTMGYFILFLGIMFFQLQLIGVVTLIAVWDVIIIFIYLLYLLRAIQCSIWVFLQQIAYPVLISIVIATIGVSVQLLLKNVTIFKIFDSQFLGILTAGIVALTLVFPLVWKIWNEIRSKG